MCISSAKEIFFQLLRDKKKATTIGYTFGSILDSLNKQFIRQLLMPAVWGFVAYSKALGEIIAILYGNIYTYIMYNFR